MIEGVEVWEATVELYRWSNVQRILCILSFDETNLLSKADGSVVQPDETLHGTITHNKISLYRQRMLRRPIYGPAFTAQAIANQPDWVCLEPEDTNIH